VNVKWFVKLVYKTTTTKTNYKKYVEALIFQHVALACRYGRCSWTTAIHSCI